MIEYLVILVLFVLSAVALTYRFGLVNVASWAQILSLLSLGSLVAIYWQFKQILQQREDPIDIEVTPIGEVILRNRLNEELEIVSIQQVRYHLNPDRDPTSIEVVDATQPVISTNPVTVDRSFIKRFDNEAFRSFFKKEVRSIFDKATAGGIATDELELVAPEILSNIILPAGGAMSIPEAKTMGLTVEVILGVIVILQVDYKIKSAATSGSRIFCIYRATIIPPGLSWLWLEGRRLTK